MQKSLRYMKLIVAILIPFGFTIPSFATNEITIQPITIIKQGNFSAGGRVIKSEGTFSNKDLFNPQGQTLHGDHATVSYQIPVNPRRYPLVFLHGAGQSANTWGTTPDGREGFATLFLRKNYSIYLVDQPRRGRAGQSTLPGQVTATTNDQAWFNMFRIGSWPVYFDNVQFSKDPEALNQYFRQMTPNTGAFDEQVISDAMVEVFKRTGEGILITHSQGGGPGWWSVIKSSQIKAVVAFEPGSGFVFPENEMPESMPSGTGILAATPIKLNEFNRLTKIPIIIYYGDNIPETPSDNPGQDNWRVRLKMAQLWVDKINQHGGKASLVHLPKIGIYGNTHFAFSDLNSDQIADLLANWLKDHKLD